MGATVLLFPPTPRLSFMNVLERDLEIWRAGVVVRNDQALCCGAPTSAHIDETGRHRGCEYAMRHAGRMA